MTEIETEAGSLRADLETLLAEIDRIGPPDTTPGPFIPDTKYDLLVTRYWDTRLQLAWHECLAHTRAQLDSVRTLLALQGITDGRRGVKSHKRRLDRIESIGVKVSPGKFDEHSIGLRRTQLERQFRRDLANACDL